MFKVRRGGGEEIPLVQGKQKTAYEIQWCDWSSDVCSSDLLQLSTAAAPYLEQAVSLHRRPS